MSTKKAAVVAMVLILCAVYAGAQTGGAIVPADTLKVDYFANAGGSVDQTVQMTNPGTAGGPLCAAVYVFAADQEMSECCSCLLTPDGLRTFSVNKDLLSNPLTPVSIPTGAIKVVSFPVPKSGVCPAYPTSYAPVAGIRAWATHLQNSGVLTETPSQNATLSVTEAIDLQIECYGIQLDGSGHGQCTCGTGDAGADAYVPAPSPWSF